MRIRKPNITVDMPDYLLTWIESKLQEREKGLPINQRTGSKASIVRSILDYVYQQEQHAQNAQEPVKREPLIERKRVLRGPLDSDALDSTAGAT
jgi:hypothetical protein